MNINDIKLGSTPVSIPENAEFKDCVIRFYCPDCGAMGTVTIDAGEVGKLVLKAIEDQVSEKVKGTANHESG